MPSDHTVESPDDPNLSASIVSRWPDGSASVVVLAGETSVNAGESRQIALRSAIRATSPLTTARVGQLLTAISINAGSAGSAILSSFGSPERVWWSNAQLICCRYRLPIGSAGLEAVIDVHAFASNRALVEVVVENGRMDSSAPVKPAAASYTNATVSVNGNVIATVSNPVTVAGVVYLAQTHEAFRAWYCSTWVGGDPGIEVIHDAAAIQQHPLLFRVDQPSNQDLQSIYGADSYQPWSTGRHRAANMGGGGDHDSIGSLTKWDTQYLQSGSRYARRAVIANALAVLSYNVNYRDSRTGLVPSYIQVAGRWRGDNSWPQESSEPAYELQHHPAVGLMAFLCQPSPVFIEVAQKIAVWCGTYAPTWAFSKWAAERGYAWGMRSYGHAIFLTPQATDTQVSKWRTSLASVLIEPAKQIAVVKGRPENPLGMVNSLSDHDRVRWGDGRPGTESWGQIGAQGAIWSTYWLGAEMHKIHATKLIPMADDAQWSEITNWVVELPIRQVNESIGGEWRYHRYQTTVGRKDWNSNTPGAIEWLHPYYFGDTIDQAPTWGAMYGWYMLDGPPTKSGPWMVSGGDPATDNHRTYSSGGYSKDSVAHTSYNYVTHFWQGLCTAVERGVPGADKAWTTVIENVTNLATWRQGFATDPRQGMYPRSK